MICDTDYNMDWH